MPESQKKENSGSPSNEHKQVGKREEKLPYDYLVVSYGSEQSRFEVSERFFNPVVKRFERDSDSIRPGKAKKAASAMVKSAASSGKRIKTDALSPAAHEGNSCRRLLYVITLKIKKALIRGALQSPRKSH